jgi:hypothetical protein
MSTINKYRTNLKADVQFHNGLIDDRSGNITTASTVGGTTGYWTRGEHGQAIHFQANTAFINLGAESVSALASAHQTGIFTIVIRAKVVAPPLSNCRFC